MGSVGLKECRNPIGLVSWVDGAAALRVSISHPSQIYCAPMDRNDLQTRGGKNGLEGFRVRAIAKHSSTRLPVPRQGAGGTGRSASRGPAQECEASLCQTKERSAAQDKEQWELSLRTPRRVLSHISKSRCGAPGNGTFSSDLEIMLYCA